METPRPWQFSLSNWSVTRKVGIVLVLPVVLATLFAVLRINNELRTLEQLEAGMLLYDAIYRWARDVTDETHNWPTSRLKED